MCNRQEATGMKDGYKLITAGSGTEVCRKQNFTSLRYHRLDDMVESIGLPKCRLCTYCFDGKE